MEDIAADDDLLSDMLLDSLEFEPKIATHKMNQAYRSPRYKTQDVIDIVRNRIVIECDVGKAVDDLLRLDVIRKHLVGKTGRQSQEFQMHARRYLETYLPASGVEFALTTRYKRAMDRSTEAQTSKAGQAEAQAKADAQACLEASKLMSQTAKGKSRMLGESGVALGTSKADLSVVATKPFKVGDLIILCKGGVKDLTKSEDEALREEAAVDRERRKEQDYNGVLGPGRDFSVIRSARKGCSQLLLGPARFVNHDCNPSCEFHRLGHSQMVFRCLRNIGLNEEITTYYGDNYFEWENSECMCRTCEERGRGFYSSLQPIQTEEPEALPAIDKETTDAEKQRRSSQRKIPVRVSPPAQREVTPTTAQIERNGKTTTKTFLHYVSQREFDENSTTHRGPKCTCLTCGTNFWAPEAWWSPDECRRCERHYRIFKADWPGRLPTEGGWSALAKNKRKELERKESEAKRRKLLHAPSPGVDSNTSNNNTSDTDTPVKLSPLRDLEDQSPPLPSTNRSKKRKKRKLEIDDGTDEDAIDAALNRVSPPQRPVALRQDTKGSVGDEESELSSVSGADADAFLLSATQRSTPSLADSEDSSSSSTASRPSGPKMLGKEAKTETLAMYWGAVSGDRRNRRQSNNALETLAPTARKSIPRSVSLRKEHRRNVSDISTASAPTKITLEKKHAVNEHSVGRRDSLPDLGHPSAEGGIAEGQLASPSIDSPYAKEAEAMQEEVEEKSGGGSTPVLATKGAARTSVQNLAMAWSAGVEEGEGGRRGSRKKSGRDVSGSTPPRGSTVSTVKKRPVPIKLEEQSPDIKPKAVLAHAEDESMDSNEPSRSFHPSSAATQATSASQPVARSASPALQPNEAPVRHGSPLAGPPPLTFTNRPGIVPGQPIRKNLRWGSGKSASSRPLVGPAASLAGPAVFPMAPSSISESSVTTLKGQASPHSPSVGRTPNGGSADGLRRTDTSPALSSKERPSSPLARAVLQSYNASTQLQHITGSNGAPRMNSNGHSTAARPDSPDVNMGPPTVLSGTLSPMTQRLQQQQHQQQHQGAIKEESSSALTAGKDNSALPSDNGFIKPQRQKSDENVHLFALHKEGVSATSHRG